MRHRASSDDRSNALWGRGSRGESRSNALWGRGGRRAGVLASAIAVFAMASVAVAGSGGGSGSTSRYDNLKSYVQDTLLSSNPQLWPWSTGAPVDWLNSSPNAATIAVVDSGIDATRTADFGTKILGQVNLASLAPNSPGDGYGHGTFVAGIAAGQAPGYAGT